MLLGDLLARFDDDTFAEEAVLSLGDLTLLARLREQAQANGERLGDYARGAVRRFAAEASDEDWVTLLGALARAEDPGAVCLKRALMHGMQAETA
ncbi:MAG: hypothetical protein ACK4UO_15710 [Pseudolabrys sp.]